MGRRGHRGQSGFADFTQKGWKGWWLGWHGRTWDEGRSGKGERDVGVCAGEGAEMKENLGSCHSSVIPISCHYSFSLSKMQILLNLIFKVETITAIN